MTGNMRGVLDENGYGGEMSKDMQWLLSDEESALLVKAATWAAGRALNDAEIRRLIAWAVSVRVEAAALDGALEGRMLPVLPEDPSAPMKWRVLDEPVTTDAAPSGGEASGG